jgi:hypothetical protein
MNATFRTLRRSEKYGNNSTRRQTLSRRLVCEGLEDRQLLSVTTPTVEAPATAADTVGLHAPTTSGFHLRNSNDAGYADLAFGYGNANSGWMPIAGDWDGDGVDTIGLYDPQTSTFYLRNSSSSGYADLTFQYGGPNTGYVAVAGDWNGDGIDTIGLYKPDTSVFYLRNTNTSGFADAAFAYGPAGIGWTPIVGDWNGDHQDTLGLFDPVSSCFYLRNTNDTGFADLTFMYGPANAGWKSLAGDWNGDSQDTVALYDPIDSRFYLRNSNSKGFADVTFDYGAAHSGSVPVVGDWDGSVENSTITSTETTSAGILGDANVTDVATSGDTVSNSTDASTVGTSVGSADTSSGTTGIVSDLTKVNGATLAKIGASGGTALIDYLTSGLVATTTSTMDNCGHVCPEDFGADPTGATSSTTAFNNMFASGATKFMCQSGATYKIANVVLPSSSDVEIDLGWATFIPDGTGVASAFTANFTTPVLHYLIHKANIGVNNAYGAGGDFTDFIKIASSGVNGYYGYVQVEDIRVVLGMGNSIVHFSVGNGAQVESITCKRIETNTNGWCNYKYGVFLTNTPGSSNYGSLDFQDIFFQSAVPDGAAVYSDPTNGAAVGFSKFDMIYATRGAALNLAGGCNNSTLSRILIEPIEANVTALKGGIFRTCHISNLGVSNSSGQTGDKLFDGTMMGCDVFDTWHYRPAGLGGMYSVVLSSTSTDNYFDGLLDAITGNHQCWPAVNDQGFRNTFKFGKNDQDFFSLGTMIERTATSGAVNTIKTIPAGEIGYYDTVTINIAGRLVGSVSHTVNFYLAEAPTTPLITFSSSSAVAFNLRIDLAWNKSGADMRYTVAGTCGTTDLSANGSIARTYNQVTSLGERVSALGTNGKVQYNVVTIDINRSTDALTAASGAVVAAPNATALTEAALQPLVAEAIARWSTAGLPASAASLLANVQVVIADLAGSYLGLTDGKTICIDRDAAGYGWFIDSTPRLDEEFASSRIAANSRAVDRIDLLTVVEHELGHVLGLDDLDALTGDVMARTLGVGVRRNPGAQNVDAVFAS